AAARALQGASAAARASAFIRTSMEGFKTSSFLLLAGRELTDFVVPVFSAADIIKASARGGKAIAAQGLGEALRRLDAIAAKATDPAGLLDRLYKSLYRTSHFTWARSTQDIKDFIDAGASKSIPDILYRGQSVVGSKDFLK